MAMQSYFSIDKGHLNHFADILRATMLWICLMCNLIKMVLVPYQVSHFLFFMCQDYFAVHFLAKLLSEKAELCAHEDQIGLEHANYSCNKHKSQSFQVFKNLLIPFLFATEVVVLVPIHASSGKPLNLNVIKLIYS